MIKGMFGEDLPKNMMIPNKNLLKQNINPFKF